MAKLNAASRAKLKERIRRIPNKAKQAAVKELNAQGAQLVARMKFVVPVHEHDLQRSIRSYPQADRRGFYSVRVSAGGALTRRPSEGGVFDYARAVEFGTEDMPAEPFFYPSFRRYRTKIRSAVTRAIRNSFKGD